MSRSTLIVFSVLVMVKETLIKIVNEVKMQEQISIEFSWRNKDNKEVIFAVCKAVAFGYNTKDSLLAALPQFSIHRIARAIDILITADMASINFDYITIHSDMNIVFELAKKKIILPLGKEEAKNVLVQRIILNNLKCQNPAGVQSLLHINVKEI